MAARTRGWGVLALAVIVLQSACATGLPMGGMVLGAFYLSNLASSTRWTSPCNARTP